MARRQDEANSTTTPLLSSRRGREDNEYGADVEDLWSNEDNASNPRNWTSTYKWMTVALVSFIEFLTTMPNFMYAPNIVDAQVELHSDDDTLATLSMTIYILGFGLGPLLFAPLSEMYGRAPVYRACLSVFLIFTAGCALSTNMNMLVAARFFAGCLGAAPVAIGGAVVGDLFEVEERGTAMSVYQAGQIISAVVGPPIGGVIGDYANWRWSFWIVCIMTGVALLCTFLVMRETHAVTIQKGLYGRSMSDTGKEQSLSTELAQALSRPLRLLVQSRVVPLCCLLIFLVIGVLNVFLTEMSRVYREVYHMSSAQSGSIYFGLAIGFVIASVVFGMTNDSIMSTLARRHKGVTQPEFRLPAAVLGMPFVVIGLLWYGWALQLRSNWVLPIIGSGFGGIGITTVQLSVTTYLVDSFDEFSASALAAITMARSVGGAVVPLLGPVLYRVLGQGWGNSVFALLNLVSCGIPILLYCYGSKWRAESKFDMS